MALLPFPGKVFPFPDFFSPCLPSLLIFAIPRVCLIYDIDHWACRIVQRRYIIYSIIALNFRGRLSCNKFNLIPNEFVEFLRLVGLSRAISFVSLLLSEGSADGVKCSEYSSSIFGRISCNILKYISFSVLDASL